MNNAKQILKSLRKIWAVLKQEPSAEVFQEAFDGVIC